MTSEVWQPLSVRLARRESLREGIPVALREPLRDWIWAEALRNGSVVPRVQRRLGLSQCSGEGGEETAAHDWLARHTRDRDLLDIADAMLALAPRPDGRVPVSDMFTQLDVQRRKRLLQELLDDVRSIYMVKADGSGLERRAGVIATRAYSEVARAAAAKPDAGSAARHLRDAWIAAHALKPDPVTAYSEAIKAVESAAHAILDPGNSRATLGTMIRQLRDTPQAFGIALAGRSGPGDVSAVTAMMALLCDGQTSRHGGREPTRPETLEAAQMAVHLAVALVEWCTSGAVRRVVNDDVSPGQRRSRAESQVAVDIPHTD